MAFPKMVNKLKKIGPKGLPPIKDAASNYKNIKSAMKKRGKC